MLAGDITTGLIHHWTFDETSGDVAHDSAGSSDGNLVNWIAGQPKWEAGRVGGALRFSSSGSYMIAQPPPITGSFAIAFWLNEQDRQGAYARIFTAKAGNVVFVANQDGRGVSYSQNNDFYTFSADPPTFNAWDHYVINFNNATGQGVIYRNGAPIAIGAFADSATGQAWVIGHHSDLTNHDNTLHGALDDFRVYDRVLKDEDIAQLASMGVPEPTHQAPVHHWTFNETTGFTAHDVAGGADGILLNWNQTEPRWQTGQVGGALRLSTADNAVVTAPVAVGARWTIAFWLNVQSKTGVNPRILEPWAVINLENNRGMGFTSRGVDTFDPTPVTLNQWEQYTITYDTVADVGTIYRNGVAVKSGYFGDNSPASAWVFGHQSGDLGNHNDSLDGILDDMRLYDRLLTPAEIQRLATGAPAVAADDVYSTNEDTPLNVAAVDGVLANDTDLDDESPKAVVDVGPLHGGLALADDGGVAYTPDADYAGPDSFTYRLTDSQGNSALATVSLTVNPVNDSPSFVVGGDRFVTDESGSRGINGWASAISAGPNETGQTLKFICTADQPDLLSAQPAVSPTGRLTYALARNKVGVVTVTVVLMDDGGTADGGKDTSAPQTFKINISKAHLGHNAINALDVTNDGAIAPNDAVAIINYINAFGSIAVPSSATTAPYWDVNSDGFIAANDVVDIINFLNASPPGSATFVGLDTTTQGDWQAQYGADGYVLNSGPTSLPSYATVSATNEYDVTWDASTTDPRALRFPDSSDRFAAAWTGHNPENNDQLNGFILDVNIAGGSNRVAVYMLDWDTPNRTQRIDVLDANTGQVLDTQQSGAFHDGKYLVWMLKGHVLIRFTNLANGLNAVASGIFFG